MLEAPPGRQLGIYYAKSSSVPPGLGLSPPVTAVHITLLGERPSLRRATPPAKKSRRFFTDGRFDALASRLLEGLRVREGAVVGTLSALFLFFFRHT